MRKVFDAGWIETYTAKRFKPLDPNPADVCLEDIAHALANKCRFTGHTRTFYSVAEHSVHCAEQARGVKAKRWALMHDAAEAYLPDIAKPIKGAVLFRLGGKVVTFESVEANLLSAIAERFELPPLEGAVEKQVKLIDYRMLLTEKRDQMGTVDWGRHPVKPYSNVHTFPGWDMWNARQQFVSMYRRLFEWVGP